MTASPPPAPAPSQAAIPAPPYGASAELREIWEAAHRGDAVAQLKLGGMYYNGR